VPNPNPHRARQEKRRRRVQAGDLNAARRALWQAIRRCEDIVLSEEQDTATHIRATHAISQAVSAYQRSVEASEFEARLSELEAATGVAAPREGLSFIAA